MHFRYLWAAAAGAALTGSGCGTVRNLSSIGERSPYGGVKCAHEWAGECAKPDNRMMFRKVGLVLWTLDLPLSALGDTLTLPYTLMVSVGRHINSSHLPPDEPPPPGNDQSPPP